MDEHLDELTLYEYLDGELDAAANQSISVHLATCSACQAHFAQLQQLFTTLDSLPETPLTVDLTPRVMEAIRPAVKPALPTWWRWVVVGEGVAAAVLALLLWPILSNLMGDWAFTLPTAEISAQLFTLWAELQRSLTFDWPTFTPLTITLPLIAWLGILGLGVLVGLVGNSLLLRPLLRSLSSAPRRGQHA